jgi:hypothetical protein
MLLLLLLLVGPCLTRRLTAVRQSLPARIIMARS